MNQDAPLTTQQVRKRSKMACDTCHYRKIKCNVDKAYPCQNCERSCVRCTLVGPSMRPSRAVSGSSSAAAAAAVAVAMATASNARFAVAAATATQQMQPPSSSLSSAGGPPHHPIISGARSLPTPPASYSYAPNTQHLDRDFNRPIHRPLDAQHHHQQPLSDRLQQFSQAPQFYQHRHQTQQPNPWSEPHSTTDHNSLTQRMTVVVPKFRDDGSGSREGQSRIAKRLHSYSSSPSSLRLSFIHGSTPAGGRSTQLRASACSPTTSTSSSSSSSCSPSSQVQVYQSLLGGLSTGMANGSPFEEGNGVGTSSVVSEEGGSQADYFTQPLSPQSVGTLTPISPNCTSLTMGMSHFTLDQSYSTTAGIPSADFAAAAGGVADPQSLPNSPPSVEDATTAAAACISPLLESPGSHTQNTPRRTILSPYILSPNNNGRVVYYEGPLSNHNHNRDATSVHWRGQQQQRVQAENMPASIAMNFGGSKGGQGNSNVHPQQQQQQRQRQHYQKRQHTLARSYSTPSIFEAAAMQSGYHGSANGSVHAHVANDVHGLNPFPVLSEGPSMASFPSVSSAIPSSSKFSNDLNNIAIRTSESPLVDSYTPHPTTSFLYQDPQRGTTVGPDRAHRFNAAVTRRRSDGLLSRYSSFSLASSTLSSNSTYGTTLMTENKTKGIHPRLHEAPGSVIPQQQPHPNLPSPGSIHPWSQVIKVEGVPYVIQAPEHPTRLGQGLNTGQQPSLPSSETSSFSSNSAETLAMCWASELLENQDKTGPKFSLMEGVLAPATTTPMILDQQVGVDLQITKQGGGGVGGENKVGTLDISSNFGESGSSGGSGGGGDVTAATLEYFGGDFSFDTTLPSSVNHFAI